MERLLACIRGLATALAIVTAGGCGGGGNDSNAKLDAYTVGGTIHLTVINPLPSGLPAGLTLQDGTDTLAVAAGATQFEFPTALTSGREFSVTVMQSPPGAFVQRLRRCGDD